MDAGTIAPPAFEAAVLALLWNLHRDIGLLRKDLGEDIRDVRETLGRDLGDLRARVSRIEGMLAGAGLRISPDPAPG